MSTAHFVVNYHGPALDLGKMDVRDLAPALLSYAQLCEEANRVLNGDLATVKVYIKATSQGSFEVSFELAQTLIAQLKGLLISDGVTAALNLRDLIFTGVAGGYSLYRLIKWLRGGTPTKIQKLNEETARIEFENETADVPIKLLSLYQDISIRVAVNKTLDPLRVEGIDEITIKTDGDNQSIYKGDLPSFNPPNLPDEKLLEDKRKLNLSIVSLAFKEGNKWRLSDGNTSINATITDRDFIYRVDNNLVSFAKGDILVCDVITRQKNTVKGLETTYEISKIIEHKTAYRQIPLNYDS